MAEKRIRIYWDKKNKLEGRTKEIIPSRKSYFKN
jgi:hypothetical protein